MMRARSTSACSLACRSSPRTSARCRSYSCCIASSDAPDRSAALGSAGRDRAGAAARRNGGLRPCRLKGLGAPAAAADQPALSARGACVAVSGRTATHAAGVGAHGKPCDAAAAGDARSMADEPATRVAAPAAAACALVLRGQAACGLRKPCNVSGNAPVTPSLPVTPVAPGVGALRLTRSARLNACAADSSAGSNASAGQTPPGGAALTAPAAVLGPAAAAALAAKRSHRSGKAAATLRSSCPKYSALHGSVGAPPPARALSCAAYAAAVMSGSVPNHGLRSAQRSAWSSAGGPARGAVSKPDAVTCAAVPSEGDAAAAHCVPYAPPPADRCCWNSASSAASSGNSSARGGGSDGSASAAPLAPACRLMAARVAAAAAAAFGFA
eukprot:365702-Chlamydomonas_euryale.AAC.40